MKALLSVLALLLMGAAAWSQAPTATILGTVTDSSGARVAGATVTVAPGATRQTTADGQGDFVLAGLPIGSYTHTVRFHPTFGNPGASFQRDGRPTAQTGKIIATSGSPRQIQFGLKYMF